MSHANARLTVHGRRLLVERIVFDRRPASHVARELGVSRQCAHRWVARFRAEGLPGLVDRSSRPFRSPSKTSSEAEAHVLEARERLRFGPARGRDRRCCPDNLADLEPSRGCAAGVIGPDDRGLDPSASIHHETPRAPHPGDLTHIDVKKLGRTPDGGGWRAHGGSLSNHRSRPDRARVGFDYVHAAVDDHSRLAYAEIHTDEQGATAAAFLTRAAAYFADYGITRIHRVISDNAFAYRRSLAFRDAVEQLGATQKFIKPHCPWQNGKVERFNRTLASEWAYRQPFTIITARHDALAPWIEHYNTGRIHSSHGLTPAARVSPTS